MMLGIRGLGGLRPWATEMNQWSGLVSLISLLHFNQDWKLKYELKHTCREPMKYIGIVNVIERKVKPG